MYELLEQWEAWWREEVCSARVGGITMLQGLGLGSTSDMGSCTSEFCSWDQHGWNRAQWLLQGCVRQQDLCSVAGPPCSVKFMKGHDARDVLWFARGVALVLLWP